MPLADRIVVAIAPRWIDHPLLAGQAELISLWGDLPVNHLIDFLQIPPSILGQPNRPAPKHRPCAALVPIPQAKLRICHWRKGRSLELNSLDCGLKPHRHSQKSRMDRLEPSETGRDN